MQAEMEKVARAIGFIEWSSFLTCVSSAVKPLNSIGN